MNYSTRCRPCAIDSPHGSVRIFGFPLLEGFPKRPYDTEEGRRNAAAYLELHIEQGPVLESMNLPMGVVLGTFGVERHGITFTGQAARPVLFADDLGQIRQL